MLFWRGDKRDGTYRVSVVRAFVRLNVTLRECYVVFAASGGGGGNGGTFRIKLAHSNSGVLRFREMFYWSRVAGRRCHRNPERQCH